MYSFIVDSSRKANFPFDLRTLATPSAVVLVNTEGSADFMYDHIFSYTAIFDLWETGKGGNEEQRGHRGCVASPGAAAPAKPPGHYKTMEGLRRGNTFQAFLSLISVTMKKMLWLPS